MALRRDYSLTKDIDFEKDSDFYSLSDEYESPDIPGRYEKKALRYIIKVYEGFCGSDKDIEKIFSMFYKYSSIDITEENYDFSAEQGLIKDLYILLDDYSKVLDEENDELGSKIDGWLSKVNPKAMSPEQKQQDIKFVAQVERTLNRRVFVYEMKSFMELLMKGALTDKGYPYEQPSPESQETSMDLPIFTHVPQEADIDIDEEDPSSSILMQVLYNIAAQNSNDVYAMFHDYENGNVCVRLWKKENEQYVPCYFSVNKRNIYLEKVIYTDHQAIWPGLIEDAVKKLGCESEKLVLAEAILGPEFANYDEEYLIGPNDPLEAEISDEFNDFVHAYVKCVFDIYGAMLLTNSLLIKDEASYVKLMFGTKEFMYVLTTCLFKSFDMASDAIVMLKQLMAEYKASVTEAGRLSEPLVKRRLSICETLSKVLYLLENDCDYHDDPRRYFESNLAKQIAVILLKSLDMEVTPESVKNKAYDVMANKTFRRKVSKMNIHILNNSNSKMAETVLAAMDGRSIN